MTYKDSPTLIVQTQVHHSLTKIFHDLTSSNAMAHLYLAQSFQPLKKGEIVEWKWPETNTNLQVFIQDLSPEKLISTVWQDTQTTVDYEFYPVSNNTTLLTLKAYGFKEKGIHLYRAMEDKRSVFDNAVKVLRTSGAFRNEKQQTPAYSLINL